MPFDRNSLLWLAAVLLLGALNGVRARRARESVAATPATPATLDDPPPARPPRDPRGSPVPVERYPELDPDEFEWMSPRPVPLDDAFARAVRRFAASGAGERARMRDAVHDDGLLVGGSHARDVPSYETPERMARFAAPVAGVLRRYGAAGSA